MSCRVLWVQDLMKDNNPKVSAVPGIHNVSDIATKRLSKPRLDDLMGYCIMGFLNGDTFSHSSNHECWCTQFEGT